MKTLTLTAVAALFTLGSLAQANEISPEVGYQPRVVATPAQVTANTYEPEVSAEAGLIPRVQARPALPRMDGYEELNPEVGYQPLFIRNGRS